MTTTMALAYITGSCFDNAIRKVAEQPHAVTKNQLNNRLKLDADTLKDFGKFEASMGVA